jgi:hypothetical protein
MSDVIGQDRPLGVIAGEPKAKSHGAATFHLEESNSSSLSNGVADQGRKRLSVNLVF